MLPLFWVVTHYLVTQTVTIAHSTEPTTYVAGIPLRRFCSTYHSSFSSIQTLVVFNNNKFFPSPFHKSQSFIQFLFLCTWYHHACAFGLLHSCGQTGNKNVGV